MHIDSYRLLQVCSFSCSNSLHCEYTKWGSSLVGGNSFDGHIYLQTPDDRSNAKWILLPDPQHDGYYRIKELQHDYYIYSGYKFDGKVYEGHIDQDHLANFQWKLSMVRANPLGQIVYLINGGHNKVLAAGQDDGNLHLQDLEDVVGELNAQWGFIFLGTQTQ